MTDELNNRDAGSPLTSRQPDITGTCCKRRCRVMFTRAAGSAFPDHCTRCALEAQGLKQPAPRTGDAVQTPVATTTNVLTYRS